MRDSRVVRRFVGIVIVAFCAVTSGVIAPPAGAAAADAYPKHVGGYLVRVPAPGEVVARSKLVVPELTCPEGGTAHQLTDLGATVDVKIHDYSSAAIRLECEGPTPSYTALLTVNLHEEPVADPVLPGDHVKLIVRIGSGGSDTRIVDVTQGWSQRLHNDNPVVATDVVFGVFALYCAFGCWPVPQFSPARVSGMSVNAAPPSGASPLSFAAVHGRAEAKPGPLDTTQSAFTLRWRFSCTPHNSVC